MKKTTEIGLGLLFSAVVVGLIFVIGSGTLKFMSNAPGRNLVVSGTNYVPCWCYPDWHETNADHIVSVFSIKTTNYNGAIIFGRHPGAGVWVEEGVRYGNLQTQYVAVAIFRDLKLLLVPPDKAEWRVVP